MMNDYGMKFQLEIIEAGQSIKRLACFDNQEHAIKFADSLLETTTKNQFLMIHGFTTNVIYIKQGYKKVKTLK